MKTKILKRSFSLLVMLIFVISVSFASAAPRKSATDLKTVISSSVTYPEYAKEQQISGFVVVAFVVDEKGNINITEMNASSLDFQLYVEKSLKEINIENPQNHKGKTYYYRFDFEII
ncbi:MAG TPA: energy transducer TonB [Bacteroidales bacterium]|nr:energy transducer TonB [Bacteroidales bacterium]HQI69166.1 energy transducer TonB [Bacteroidales bacterium]